MLFSKKVLDEPSDWAFSLSVVFTFQEKSFSEAQTITICKIIRFRKKNVTEFPSRMIDRRHCRENEIGYVLRIFQFAFSNELAELSSQTQYLIIFYF